MKRSVIFFNSIFDISYFIFFLIEKKLTWLFIATRLQLLHETCWVNFTLQGSLDWLVQQQHIYTKLWLLVRIMQRLEYMQTNTEIWIQKIQGYSHFEKKTAT